MGGVIFRKKNSLRGSEGVRKEKEASQVGGEEVTEDEMVGWHHQLSGNEFEPLQEILKDRKPDMLLVMGLQRVGHY